MAEISSMLEGCNSLHTLRLDNCSNATISKIINESGMPTEPIIDLNTGQETTRKIYCKEENAAGLTAPNGWEFSYVTEEEPEVPVDPPAGDIPLYVPGEFANNEEITEVRTMVTSDHTDLSYMFNNCFNLISVNTEDWDTSNVTNMNGMFNNCYKLTSLDLRNFDISNVTNTEGILQGCNALKELHLDNCSNVTISKIINDPYVPTGGRINFDTGQMENRKIYCKASEIGDLVAPNGWEFVTVE
jgi:surface protein